MKCERALQLIDAYINNELQPKDLEEFLNHIRECPECYDELETFFTINVGIKYLEEEKLESYNIPEMLKEDLRKKEQYLRKRKKKIIFGITTLTLGIVGCAVWFLSYLGILDFLWLF